MIGPEAIKDTSCSTPLLAMQPKKRRQTKTTALEPSRRSTRLKIVPAERNRTYTPTEALERRAPLTGGTLETSTPTHLIENVSSLQDPTPGEWCFVNTCFVGSFHIHLL